MRLIDADKLIEDIECSADLGGALGLVVECVKKYACFMVSSATTISAQPERTEIIHCAECKFLQCNMSGDGYLPKGVPEFECRHWCGETDPTDYCSYAERR